MSYLLALLLLVVAGIAILRLARVDSGSLGVDVPLGWFVGCGWFALAAFSARFLAQIPYGRWSALAILLLPPAAWAVARWRYPALLGPARAEGEPRPQYLPRPLWLFLPLAAYVLLVAASVVLHGANTPTHTDDGVRVRAYTPMLAFEDEWIGPARALLMMAGPVTTFVPSLGWSLTGTLDHFHANYFVVTALVAFLALAVGLATRRGAPERGWAQAFAILSIPFFVYHCTSTYADAVLALFLAAGALFAMEFGRSGAIPDAVRAGLLWGVAAMVKREGEVVAGSLLLLLALQFAWQRRREGQAATLRVAGALAVPLAIFVAGKIAAVGLAEAVPMLGVLGAGGAASGGGPDLSATRWEAVERFGYALFRSGNAGVVFWLLPAPLLLRPRLLRDPGFGWTLAAVLVTLAETAYVSIISYPQFTLDQSTVHRALLTPAVLGACWIAAAASEHEH